MQKALWEPPKNNNWSFLFLKATSNSREVYLWQVFIRTSLQVVGTMLCSEDQQQHKVRKKVVICQILNAKHFLNKKKAIAIPKLRQNMTTWKKGGKHHFHWATLPHTLNSAPHQIMLLFIVKDRKKGAYWEEKQFTSSNCLQV